MSALDLFKNRRKKKELKALLPKVKELQSTAYRQTGLVKTHLLEDGTRHREQFEDSLQSPKVKGGRQLLEIYGTLASELEGLGSAINSGDTDQLQRCVKDLHIRKHDDSTYEYGVMFEQYADYFENGAGAIIGTPHQDVILEAIVRMDGLFTKKSMTSILDDIGSSVIEYHRHRVASLHEVYKTEPKQVLDAYQDLLMRIAKVVSPDLATEPIRRLPDLEGFKPKNKEPKLTAIDEMKQKIADMDDWSQVTEALSHFYFEEFKQRTGHFGIGVSQFGIYIVPKRIDNPAQLEDLVGYKNEIGLITQNTEALLNGNSANHAFLYGAPGTGKTTLVQALGTEYSGQGLRVVSTPKQIIPYLPSLFEEISESDNKYIFVVDEFKLGKEEELYTHMKQVIEGDDPFPSNAVMYVLSNDKTALKLGFSGKKTEIAALQDRFGLVVEFPIPKEDEFQTILKHILKQEEVDMPEEEVQKKLQEYKTSRELTELSPRHAVQFVKTLDRFSSNHDYYEK